MEESERDKIISDANIETRFDSIETHLEGIQSIVNEMKSLLSKSNDAKSE